MTALKGMTWSHPRGYDPMVACSALWNEKTGVSIEWDKRSLQGFESFPVEELARAYDLIVIDHPHVGQITAEGCLAPLDVPGRGLNGRRYRRGASASPIQATTGRAGSGRFRSMRPLRCRPGGRMRFLPLRSHGPKRFIWRGRAGCFCRCGRRIR